MGPAGFAVGDRHRDDGEGDSETISLAALGAGVFRTGVLAEGGLAVPDNGRLEAGLSDTVTFTYDDADDGSGAPAVVTVMPPLPGWNPWSRSVR